MELLILCLEFLKTGFFSVGGGLATLPFLSQMAIDHPHWFTQDMLADMIAISESTPGPIGVNMATYVGYTVAGIPGALVATLSLVLPSIVVILVIARFLNKYNENKLVQNAFSGLRPAVTGLVAAAGFSVLRLALLHEQNIPTMTNIFDVLDWRATILFLVVLVLNHVKKLKNLHPAAYIGAAAVAGIVFKL